MHVEVEWLAAERFLGGPPTTDEGLCDHIFLWAATKAARGKPADLDRHRQGDILTDEATLRCLMRYSPKTITDLARLCEVIEFTESVEYRLAVIRANGWLH